MEEMNMKKQHKPKCAHCGKTFDTVELIMKHMSDYRGECGTLLDPDHMQ